VSRRDGRGGINKMAAALLRLCQGAAARGVVQG